ncbi:MAG: AzlD domain-containing protein [Dongiaceae bacterium]
MTYVAMILGMAAITVAIRAAVFVLGDRLMFPPLVRQALEFVPVTVLTAIIVPMVVAPQGEGLELTWRNPQLVGALVAVALCAATRHQLLTIVGAMLVFFGWQFWVLS